jgi:Asp/Glu/hydantoin racemase
MQIGLIRVRTLEAMGATDRHGPLIEGAFPGLLVHCHCIKDQVRGIHDDKSEALALPKVIELGRQLGSKVDVIIVSCAADPGVEELNKELQIPVIGAGRSAAGIARTLGDSVGVITITDNIPDAVRAGLGKHFLVWKKVKGVETALDLESDAGYENTMNAAEELRGQGSNVIALACTGFSTMAIAPKIAKSLGIPVVDPVLAAGSIAYSLMLNRKG